METQDRSWQIGAAISFGWDRFKDNVGLLIGALAVIAGVNIGFSWILGSIDTGFLTTIILLAQWAVSIAVSMGVIRITLNLTDDVPAEIGDLFVFDANFFPYVIASIIFAIMFMIGLFLFIIPGIIVALVWGMFAYVIVDRDAGIGESLNTSAEITKGNRWHLLGFGVVLSLFNLLGFITIVGWIITIPVSSIAATSVYRAMSGPRTVS